MIERSAQRDQWQWSPYRPVTRQSAGGPDDVTASRLTGVLTAAAGHSGRQASVSTLRVGVASDLSVGSSLQPRSHRGQPTSSPCYHFIFTKELYPRGGSLFICRFISRQLPAPSPLPAAYDHSHDPASAAGFSALSSVRPALSLSVTKRP